LRSSENFDFSTVSLGSSPLKTRQEFSEFKTPQ
jgi:hypothetical protein